MFLPHPRVQVSIVGSLRDREVACSASDRQGLNFESCVWRTMSSQSSHHPQEVLLAQFSLYVHKGGLNPDSSHLPCILQILKSMMVASPPVFYFFYRNRLANWHSFPDITYIEVNNALKLAILHLIELIFFRIYLYLKPHIFIFCFMVLSNVLANWHGLSYTTVGLPDILKLIWTIVSHFEFGRVEICQVISLHETAHFVL